MEAIQTNLKGIVDTPKHLAQIEQMKKQLLENPDIREFIKAETVSKMMFEKNLATFWEFKTNTDPCYNCPGLDKCPNLLKGYKPLLNMNRKQIELMYRPCEQKRKEEERNRQRSLVRSLYIPKEIMEAKFTDFISDNPTRLEANTVAYEFAVNARPGEDGRGLFLHGKFGVGKTFIMGAIANELADRKMETMLVYTPDFFREMKQSIGEGTVNEKLDSVKKAQVLILDDIGAENMSSWIRDEVLGVILQYRMLEKLPTLFTSNYDLDGLENHLAFSEKNGVEELKAKRIMERIRHYSTVVFIDDVNRRQQKNS